ncbi:GlxA family transcriptional regulator [Demequina salsinemoris]|uniref:GlxA family transcriptional regulator n=1 Tax=Demequina salsinemoris TaxID=577470 RepID=UPI000784B998|nr:DJ-1/PfpI family protein [Demequina salsinemoris]
MRRIGILLYENFDLIDAGGPYEVFLTASRLAIRDGEAPLYDVVLISAGGDDVEAFGGMTLTGLVPVAEAGDLDVVLVPGLVDLAAARADSRIAEAVTELAERSSLVTSVCTGAFLLGDAGLLKGRPATTHWEDVPELGAHDGVGEAVAGVRWVDDGDVVTSGGLTSGIHMALHLVARDQGVEMAQRTARQLDLDWSPTPER